MLIVALILVVFRKVPIHGGCVIVSVLMHYFTLVAVMWMVIPLVVDTTMNEDDIIVNRNYTKEQIP